MVGTGDLLSGLAIPGPKVLHGFVPSFSPSLDHMLVSSHSALAVRMESWELFVFSPASAMDKMPGSVCFGWSSHHRFLSVDGLDSSAITAYEVHTFAHKSWKDFCKSRTPYL